jgi:hypothetical protein
MPATVVSKKPLDPKEPPLATPSLPGYQPKQSENVSKGTSLFKSPKSKRGPRDDPGEETQGDVLEDINQDEDYAFDGQEAAMSMWKLVHPHLTRTPFSPIPVRGYVPELLVLPLLRPIEFNPLATNKYFESRAQDIGALIMQITGQKAHKPCDRCQQGKGPFNGCVVISPDAPLWARRLVTGCANCFYKCNQTYCDLNAWSRKTYPELTDSSIISAPSLRPGLHTTASSNSIEKSDNTPERRSGRVFTKVSSPAAKFSTRVAQRVVEPDLGARHLRNRDEASQSRSTRRGVDTSESRSSVANHDKTLGLSMEDWEIAPGRIRNESSDDVESKTVPTASYLMCSVLC